MNLKQNWSLRSWRVLPLRILRLKFSSLIIPFVVFSILSCNTLLKNKDNKQKPIAQAYDKILYAADLKGLLPKGVKPQDSITTVKEYIQHWLQEQVLLRQANNNLDESQKDVSRQIEDYRNSLIIFAYEKELVREKLDTNVNDSEIDTYYEQNKKDFELKNDIVRINYVKVANKSPNIEKLKPMLVSKNPQDKEKLAKYCYQYAENFFLDDKVWLMFDDVLKEIPIQTYNQDLFLQSNNNQCLQLNDTANVYLLSIKGYMIKNSISPLSFEKENIKKILLNKRKLELIDKVKKGLLEQAQNGNELKVY
jgi:hypothetical protein